MRVATVRQGRQRRVSPARAVPGVGDSPAFVQAVLDTVGALVVVLDRTGRIVLFNRQCEEVTGYTFAEVRGRRFWRLFLLPKEMAGVRVVFEQLRLGRVPNRWENHWRTKDGRRRRIAWSNTALTDADSQVTHIIGTGIDVTEQRAAEAALSQAHDELEQRVAERTMALAAANARLRQEVRERRTAQEALRQSEERLRLVCAAAPVGIFEADRRGRWVFANDYLRSLCGLTTDTVRGHRWSRCLHPADRQAFAADFAAARRAERPFQREVRVVPRGGDGRWVMIRTQPLRRVQGRSAGLVGTVLDITERRRTEEELRQRTGELAHLTRVQTVGETTAMLAHELSQPLAAIQNFAQGGLRRLCSNNGSTCNLGFALRNIAQEATRAGQIMDMVRGLVCRHRPRLAPVDAHSLVREVARLMEPDLRRAGVRLELALVNGGLPVAADRVQIEQVLVNLVRNAVEAMERTPARRRWLRVSTHGGASGIIEVVVEDGGPGLSGEHLARVFEPFHTTKPGGMGVGLAICRTIVQSHGGRIWVESPAGRGAAFHFTLPTGAEPT